MSKAKSAPRSSDTFDVICIGAGTVGETVAGGLKGSGISLAVLERDLVGGECPYWGCMPSKTLLRSAETLAEAVRARKLAASRVEFDIDFPKVSKRTLWMARDLDDAEPAKSIQGAGATLIRGSARLIDARTVEIDGRRLRATKAVVIANGTLASVPPIPGIEGIDYWTNRQATVPKALPKSIAVLGAGAIGAELSLAFARLGSTVHLIEGAPRVVPLEEPEAGELLKKHLRAEGIKVHTGAKVVGVEKSGKGVRVKLEGGSDVTAERLLVATGRKSDFEGWDLEAAGLSKTERGWLKTDPLTLLAAPGVYGGGDVTGLGGFTHLSYYHGQLIARALRGEKIKADHSAIPRVTFTDPEVASVGMSEKQARDSGIDVAVGSTDAADSARGYIQDFQDGLIKIVADRKRKVVVGATIVSPRAGEMIGELILAVKAGTPIAVLKDTVRPFPTFSRVIGGVFDTLEV